MTFQGTPFAPGSTPVFIAVREQRTIAAADHPESESCSLGAMACPAIPAGRTTSLDPGSQTRRGSGQSTFNIAACAGKARHQHLARTFSGRMREQPVISA